MTGRVRIWLVFLAVVVGCSGADRDEEDGSPADGDADSDGDGDCDPGAPRVTIACPDGVDLGCVPAAGATADLAVTASSCEGPAPATECSSAAGELFGPGETAVTCTATTGSGAEASCHFTVTGEHEGGFELACSSEVAVECAGAVTPADVPDPAVVEGCGALEGTLMSDAPAAGYGAGETAVTFAGSGARGFTTSCVTTVRVADTTPPSLTCPTASTVVRGEPDGVAAPPAVTAADLCDGPSAAAPTPAALGRGTTTVTYNAVDRAGLTASCAVDVTVLDGLAPAGLRIVSARLSGETTSVTLAWEPSEGADATGYRVERAPAAAGPFVSLGMVGASTLNLTDGALPGDEAHYRVVTLVGTRDGGATAPIRAFAIDDGGYTIRGQSVPTLPFSTTLYGVVRHPRDLGSGPFPLVAFLHGNHGNCRPSPFTTDDICQTRRDHECTWSGYTTTPNAEGLAYLGETLAAQGYVTVSISGNAINCRDGFIFERAELIVEHLRRWATWSSAGAPPFDATFVGAVDMTRVGLVGHSRGGEAVAHVPSRLAATPVAGVSVASIFSIAPTDYNSPTVDDIPYGVLLPSCDGDVWTLDGMHIYDRALSATARQPRAQVFFIGANHNFFNTEWVYDDNRWGAVCDTRDEIGDEAQQGMLEATLGAWMEGTIPTGATPEPFLRADGPTPEGIAQWAGSALDLRWSYSSESRVLVDDFGGGGAPTTNRLGLANAFTDWNLARSCYETDCDASFWHELDGVMLSWNGGTPLASFGLGGLDTSTRSYLSFRVTSRRSSLNTSVSEQDFVIRAVDGDGTEVVLLLSEVTTVPHLYPSASGELQREMLQTVRVHLPELTARDPAFDATTLESFDLEMTAPGHTRGSVIITDVDVAAE